MKHPYRGYIPFAAFLIAIIACALLLAKSHNKLTLVSNLVYSLSIVGLYGVSSLYHSRIWSSHNYSLVRSIDHAAIFALIAGSATPVCLLGLKGESGLLLLFFIWFIALMGMLMVTFWAGPNWIRASLYVALGWIGASYFPEMKSSLGSANFWMLVAGGVIYTIGALVYAFKRPDPFPQFFGYHEIFHVLVVIASGFHFMVIYNLTVSYTIMP